MIFIKTKTLKIILLFLLLCISSCTYIYALTPRDELIYEGVDVSNWQGNINFAEVKNAGIEIVYIKASEGTTFVDPYLESNYANAKANGLKVGFYHYLTATSVEGAIRQANFFASVIAGKEVDCRLAMDYEEFFGEGKTEINEIAVAFIERLRQITGKDVIVYSNLNNIRNTFGDDVALEGDLWVAYYSNPNNLINVNSSWETYIGIQYTSSGRVPGISGNVDRDRFSKEILMDEIPGVDIPEQEANNIINYIVKSGDTLSAIALRYGTTVAEIARINNIQNVNLIYPGQVLEIIINSSYVPSTQNQIVYTIRRGDTLWAIANRYGVTVQNLVSWNNIQNPNLIYTGNTLVIYTNGGSNTGTSGSNSQTQYVVKRGDTLWGIAMRYGTTVNSLVSLNGIRNRNLIYPGQVLRIY
ncbi:MAG: LysM peptidoglycan-binding domain-containing protein [Clostridia bacterium]|nr:LysM peptidoglycan-binding domain-containing protein [Clostridia bacterium]